MSITSRYSEFCDLRNKLLVTFPHAGAAMPPLPPKSMICGYLHAEDIIFQLMLKQIDSSPNFSRREKLVLHIS